MQLALTSRAKSSSLNSLVAKGADCVSHLKWDSFGLGFCGGFKERGWLEVGRGLAAVDCQDFGSGVSLGNVSASSLDENRLHSAECLIDPATLNSHFQLFGEVEWVRLKFGFKAIDEAFKNPTFAPGAFFEGWECRNERFGHLRSPP